MYFPADYKTPIAGTFENVWHPKNCFGFHDNYSHSLKADNLSDIPRN